MKASTLVQKLWNDCKSRRPKVFLLLIAAFFVVPPAISVAFHPPSTVSWSEAALTPSGLSPDPAKVKEPVVQVFAAPAFGRRSDATATSSPRVAASVASSRNCVAAPPWSRSRMTCSRRGTALVQELRIAVDRA